MLYIRSYFSKYHLSLLCLLLFISCSDIKNSNKSESSKTEEEVVIISSLRTNSPIRITRKRSFNYLFEPESYLSHANDTLRLKVSKFQLLRLEYFGQSPDSIVVTEGDTVILRQTDSVTIKKSIRNKVEKAAIQPRIQDYLDEELLNFLDSIKSQFYKVDRQNPLLVKNDYSRFEIFPIIPNYKNIRDTTRIKSTIKSYDSILENFAHTTYDVLNTKNEYISYELLKDRYFNDVFTLFRVTKNKTLEDFLIDQYLGKNNNSELLNYDEFRLILLDVLFPDLKESTRSVTYYYLPKIYDSIDKVINDSVLIKRARQICLEEMILQGNPFNELNNFYQTFKKNYRDTLFINYFESKYLISLKEKYNSTADLNLINSNGEIITFFEIKRATQGKSDFCGFLGKLVCTMSTSDAI